MKKILLCAVLSFTGNLLLASELSELNTINFKYSMDTGNHPWGFAVTKLSDTLYEINGGPKIQLTTEHAFTLVVDSPEEPSEEPYIGMLVCDDQGQYFMLPFNYDYGTADKQKNQKNFERAQIPPKTEKPIISSSQKQYSLLRLSIGALAMFGGYELINKIINSYQKNRASKTPVKHS